MEGKKHVGSSASSFTNDLFGSRDSSPSSSGIIGALFSPASKALGKEALRHQVPESNKNSTSGNESFKAKTDAANGKEGEKYSGEMGSIYQEQRMQQPCNLSSSIYYGGQDIYPPPPGTHNSTIKKDVSDDDAGSASRGNWWQGSLYY